MSHRLPLLQEYLKKTPNCNNDCDDSDVLVNNALLAAHCEMLVVRHALNMQVKEESLE